MRLLLSALLLATVTASLAADPAEEVRQAEIAFAKAFADRDQAKFFSFVLEDATFLGGQGTQRGKAAVVERWSNYFKSPVAPFSWGPERVSVNAAGNIGLSTGPVFGPDGKVGGSFISTWVRQDDGSWKILFDSGGPSPAPFAGDEVKVEEGFVKADDGVKLHYRKAGRGPQTVIIPLDSVMFDDFKSLADIATVITYDLRGRGKSEKLKTLDNVSIQWDVRDLEAVRRELKVEQFVPMGYSYLGVVAAMYAMEHPTRVTRVIQLSPGPMRQNAHKPHTRDDAGITPGTMEKLAAAEKTMSPKEYCELEWNEFFRYILVGNPANATRMASPCADENEWPASIGRHWKKLWEGSIKDLVITPEQARKVTVPVLVIHGTKDRQAPYAGGREWAAALGNARLVTVEGAAHQTWADDPVTVHTAIREFLRKEWPMAAVKP